MHALLARAAGLGDLAAGPAAGVAQRVAQLAAHDRHAVDRVARRFEAALDRLARVAHARAEHGELVDGVVNLQREPGEHDQGAGWSRASRATARPRSSGVSG